MSKCIICGKSEKKDIYSGLSKCLHCSLIYYDKEIKKEEIHELYNEKYFFGDEYLDYLKDKKTLQKNFIKRIRTLKRYSEGGGLLEVGCAYGFFLELAKKNWNVKGMDISRDACEFARREFDIPIIHGDFLNEDIEHKIDVFCMWDTIEHLSSPDLYIQKISNNMKKGGLICITTGDVESLNARVQKKRWRLIHPPTHLYYFSRKTLTLLLEKYGFEIIHFEKVGSYRSLTQIVYSLFFIKNKNKNIFTYLEKKKLLDMDIYINIFDIMYVIARKTK